MSEEIASFNALVSVFQSNTQTINTLWGIFYAIGLALLGFVYKADNLRTNPRFLIVLSVGFFFFATSNKGAISRYQVILKRVEDRFHDPEFLERFSDSGLVSVMDSHVAVAVPIIQLTHVAFTLAILAALWAPYCNLARTKIIAKDDQRSENESAEV